MWRNRFDQLPRQEIDIGPVREGPRWVPRGGRGPLLVPVATGFRARTLGLTLLDRSDAGPGLLIPRCSAVHTFGMRFALDLYFLDAAGAVLAVRRAVPPRRFAGCRAAAAVLEVPAADRIGERETYPIDTYVILRRNGWASGADLEAAAARSSQVGDEQMSDDIRWIRSYAPDEGDGAVADNVLVRPDPEPAAS